MNKLPSYLAQGEPARLIPITADTARERKSASVLLAGMSSVLELRQALLKSIGQRVGTTARLDAFTEIVFTNLDPKDKSRDRPDGLLVLRTGRKEWKALIEAKVGHDEVSEGQVTKYLAQAKAHGIDAVITITNQFAALPTHHPVKLTKRPPKGVELFHWSWGFIRTQCGLLLKNEQVEDGDQVYILSEIDRYFQSEKAGILNFTQMNKEWRDVVNKVKSRAPLNRTSDEVINTVTAWHQEARDLCLIMSRDTGSEVALKLKNSHRSDAGLRLKEEASDFVKNPVLSCTLAVPNAASDIEVRADLGHRTVTVSMALTAPKDRKSTKAKVNWLLRQLKKTAPEGMRIRATRPGKAAATQKTLAQLREAPDALESETSNSAATTLEVIYEIDLAGKFAGNKVFIDQLEAAVPHFYKEAGQWLKAWVPPAPKIDNRKSPHNEAEPAADPDSD